MTKEVREEICFRLAGGESLRSICVDNKMPALSTVLLAVVQDRDGFSVQYMQAREAGGFSHADRIIDTVDKVAAAELDPQSARAMIDGLKWAAERMASKHHSSRQEIDHSSTDKSMSPTPALDTSKLSTAALKELMNARETPDTK
jgi:hypothetical protein